jgi:hypothetical protein
MRAYERMTGLELAEVLLRKLTQVALQGRELAVDAVVRSDPKAMYFAGQAKTAEGIIDFLTQESKENDE